jgi:RNA polymerase sigma-70 factor (ECF subfamily)
MMENLSEGTAGTIGRAERSERVEEDAWVEASRRGDALSFNRLVLRWERTVYNLALRMLDDREEAAEAAQETFLLAFRGIGRFRRGARFSTWLYRIALNRCLSRLRSRPRGVHLSLDAMETVPSGLEVPGTQEKELLRSERNRKIAAALARLPPEQRAAVELRFFQELTFEEIAQVLEVSPSTVKSRIHAGLEILRLRLADEHGGGGRK